MKYLLLIFFLFGLSTTAQAQSKTILNYHIGGGLSSPVSPNEFNNNFNNGYGLEGFITGFSDCTKADEDSSLWNCSALGTDIGFIFNNIGRGAGDDFRGGDISLSLIRANARYLIDINNTSESVTQLYLTGGYNRHFINVSDLSDGNTSISFERESGNGFNYGIGIKTDRSGYGFYLQYTMYNLFTEGDDNLVYGGLTLGFKVSTYID